MAISAIALPRLARQERRIPHLSDIDDVADPDVNFRQVANGFVPIKQLQLIKFNREGSVRRHHHW
jgi:hypothetical protein